MYFEMAVVCWLDVVWQKKRQADTQLMKCKTIISGFSSINKLLSGLCVFSCFKCIYFLFKFNLYDGIIKSE